MSKRTIVEFTDSKLIRIAANPSEFMDALLLALVSGEETHWADLSRWGVRLIENEPKGDDR